MIIWREWVRERQRKLKSIAHRKAMTIEEKWSIVLRFLKSIFTLVESSLSSTKSPEKHIRHDHSFTAASASSSPSSFSSTHIHLVVHQYKTKQKWQPCRATDVMALILTYSFLKLGEMSKEKTERKRETHRALLSPWFILCLDCDKTLSLFWYSSQLVDNRLTNNH